MLINVLFLAALARSIPTMFKIFPGRDLFYGLEFTL